jgi:hypothetical protein
VTSIKASSSPYSAKFNTNSDNYSGPRLSSTNYELWPNSVRSVSEGKGLIRGIEERGDKKDPEFERMNGRTKAIIFKGVEISHASLIVDSPTPYD